MEEARDYFLKNLWWDGIDFLVIWIRELHDQALVNELLCEKQLQEEIRRLAFPNPIRSGICGAIDDLPLVSEALAR